MRLQETTSACLLSMDDGHSDYKTKRHIDMTIVMVLLLLPVTGYTQWLNYPTASVPRLPNGLPNLTVAPRELLTAGPTTQGCGNPIHAGELNY